MARRNRLVLLVALGVMITACSLTVEVGGTSTSVGDEFALSDLVGDWGNGQLFLQIADDGSYQALETADSDPDDPLMGGFIARDGNNLSFVTDIYGECSGQTGVYEVLLSEGQLLLILVDDPCEFRSDRFVDPWESSG
jgi:hypothetical protein